MNSRNCPCCNIVLTYSNKSNCENAEKVGRKCYSCGQNGNSKEDELKIAERTCSKCDITKPIKEFKFRKDRQRYHTVCNVCVNKRRQEWRKNNPEGDKNYQKSDKNKERRKIYREKNKVVLSDKAKLYHKRNKEVRNKKNHDRYKDRLKADPVFRLKHNIRRRLNSVISNGGYTKRSRTMEYLGCDFDSFKLHIESQFESWMTWDNYGGIPTGFNQCWDLDHIIPISKAITEEDVYRLTNYSNLQPLCSYYNRYVKSNRENV
jgi:hypothetical protein